jgi:hypothetical protein
MNWFGRSKQPVVKPRYGDWMQSNDEHVLVRCSDGMIVARVGDDEERQGEFLAMPTIGWSGGRTRSFLSVEDAKRWAYRYLEGPHS